MASWEASDSSDDSSSDSSSDSNGKFTFCGYEFISTKHVLLLLKCLISNYEFMLCHSESCWKTLGWCFPTVDLTCQILFIDEIDDSLPTKLSQNVDVDKNCDKS